MNYLSFQEARNWPFPAYGPAEQPMNEKRKEKINHFLNFSDDRPNRHSTDWTAGFGLQPQHLDGPFPRSRLVTRSPMTHILNIFLPKLIGKMLKNEWKSIECRGQMPRNGKDSGRIGSGGTHSAMQTPQLLEDRKRKE